MPEYRIRQIPSAPWRIVQSRAGNRLQEGLRRLIELWAADYIDPLGEGDPIRAALAWQRSALAAKGAQALNASRTPAERTNAARHAVDVRWAKYRAEHPRAPATYRSQFSTEEE